MQIIVIKITHWPDEENIKKIILWKLTEKGKIHSSVIIFILGKQLTALLYSKEI